MFGRAAVWTKERAPLCAIFFTPRVRLLIYEAVSCIKQGEFLLHGADTLLSVFALPWEVSAFLKIVDVGKGLLDSLLWGTPCSLLSPYVTGVVLY